MRNSNFIKFCTKYLTIIVICIVNEIPFSGISLWLKLINNCCSFLLLGKVPCSNASICCRGQLLLYISHFDLFYCSHSSTNFCLNGSFFRLSLVCDSFHNASYKYSYWFFFTIDVVTSYFPFVNYLCPVWQSV